MHNTAATLSDEPLSRFELIKGTRAPRHRPARPTSTRVIYIATARIVGQIADGLPSFYDAALARLRAFRGWGENWDGENGPAPNKNTISAATDMLSLLEITRLSFVVDLDANANPMFFLRGSIWVGEILLENDGSMSFEFRQGEDVLDGYDLEFDRKALPASLQRALDHVSELATDF